MCVTSALSWVRPGCFTAAWLSSVSTEERPCRAIACGKAQAPASSACGQVTLPHSAKIPGMMLDCFDQEGVFLNVSFLVCSPV